jgi:hypothetical protein
LFSWGTISIDTKPSLRSHLFPISVASKAI